MGPFWAAPTLVTQFNQLEVSEFGGRRQPKRTPAILEICRQLKRALAILEICKQLKRAPAILEICRSLKRAPAEASSSDSGDV